MSKQPLFNSQDIEDIYPLSDIQKGLVFHSMEESDSLLYYGQFVYRIYEPGFNPDGFTKAFSLMVQKHSILRTGFNISDFDEPVQIVYGNIPLPITYVDNSSMPSHQSETQIDEYIASDKKNPFNMNNGELLWRLRIFDLGAGNIRVVWSAHHAIIDGWSFASLMAEFNQTYLVLKRNPSYIPPKLRASYKDFVIREIVEKKKNESHMFWKSELDGFKPLKIHRADKISERESGFKGGFGGYFTKDLGQAGLKSVQDAAFRYDISVKHLCFTAYIGSLSMLSYDNDILVGLASHTRPECTDGDKIIGCFINVLPFRFLLPWNITWENFSKSINRKMHELKKHERLSFFEIARIANDETPFQNRLFDITFNFMDFNISGVAAENRGKSPGNSQDSEESDQKSDHTSVGTMERHVTSNISFDFGVNISTGKLVIQVRYNIAVFTEDLVKRLCGYFENALNSIILHPGREMSKNHLMSEEEKKTLLEIFNRPFDESMDLRSLYDEFSNQVNRTPDHVAVTCKEEQFSYRFLKERADRIAVFLSMRGAKAGDIITLLVDRSFDMAASIWGILKTGAAYLPIESSTPVERITRIIEDSGSNFLLTHLKTVKKFRFTDIQHLSMIKQEPKRTGVRPQIQDFDSIPIPNRRLVSYAKYDPYIGDPMIKNTYITMQTTRGCPYNCAYCHKIWPKSHVFRSAENVFQEVKLYYDMGVRRFSFVDDVQNLNIKNSRRFFQMLVDNGMKVQLFFPAGLRGDILTKDYIDLLMEAGTSLLGLALETASPRIQKLIGKNLNLPRFRENTEYICEKYPNVLMELYTMHGFPSETEEEAMMTLDFIKNLEWVHFPYVNILRIYSNTEMEKLALENGITRDQILASETLAYHEIPETLPFDKSFTLKYQFDFFNNYLLSRERLLHVLPYQAKILTRDEIVQKYNSYFPVEINSFEDLLSYVKISEDELNIRFLPEDHTLVPDLDEKILSRSPQPLPGDNALKVLLMDLSQFFTSEGHMLYDLVEPPLGLLYLGTYLEKTLRNDVHVKIAKSRLDFNNFDQLRRLLEEFHPDLIGIRTLTFYKDFFHQTINMMRKWGIDVPIITGGPYATSSYKTILQDENVDLVVLGEGEITLFEIISKMIKNEGRFPSDAELEEIQGLAFIPRRQHVKNTGQTQDILLLDALEGIEDKLSRSLPDPGTQPGNPAYIIYTSGSTGTPKGVVVSHFNVTSYIDSFLKEFPLNPRDVMLQQASVAFDAFVEEFYPVLFRGGKVAIPNADVVKDIDWLSQFITEQHVTVVDCSPLLLNELNRIGNFPSVHTFISGGDVLKRAHVDRFLKTAAVYNTYGPTETTVCAAYYKCTGSETDEIPIGKPVSNYNILILDCNHQLLPVGVPGELCVFGAGVALGYLNHPELTAEKFFAHELNELNEFEITAQDIAALQTPTHTVGYKTGDLACWMPDGNLVYLGRIDQQVKIRGFRIEVGEIETRLKALHGVRDAVVIVRGEDNDSGDRFLCAYLVCDSQLDDGGIRNRLNRFLPYYMIPAHFIMIDKIPLTPSGKLDKKRLPDPLSIENIGEPISPDNAVEQKLAGIWSDVLGIERSRINRDTDFFKAGGHSLKAIVLVGRIHNVFNTKIPINEVFKIPTIRELAKTIAKTETTLFIPIKPAEEKEYFPLSQAQKRFYILQAIDETSIRYNIPIAFFLEGTIDAPYIEDVFRRLILRHENLRTSFRLVADQPVQVVHRSVEFRIETSLTPGNPEDVFNPFIRPFDLSRAPLFRVAIFPVTGEKHLLIVDMHHIISDAVSHSILLRDFAAIYSNPHEPLPPLNLQYKDYSQWQNSHTEREELLRQESFWLDQFADEIPVLQLPTDFKRPEVQSFEGSDIHFNFGQDHFEHLKKFLDTEGMTLFQVLLASFAIFLSKLTDQLDIVVGSPVVGRRHPDLEKIPGVFTNTLALKNPCDGEKTVREFLKEVKTRTLEALRNQDYQFEELVERVKIKRDTSRNPLFDVMLTLQHKEENNIRVPNLGISPFPFKPNASKFDLTLYCMDSDHNLFFSMEYCSRLFKQQTVERYASYFKRVLQSIIADPSAKIMNIPMIPDDETQRLISDFNRSHAPFSQDKTITLLIEEQVQRTPNHPAVIEAESNSSLSYRDLNQKADRLAAHLITRGLKPGMTAAILGERRSEIIVGILAILKTRASFLPLDLQNPPERIGYILKDSRAHLVLTQENVIKEIGLAFEPYFPHRVVPIDDPSIYNTEAAYAPYPGQPSHIAYIIYTSGTTGKPKGVVIEHRSLVNYISWAAQIYVKNEPLNFPFYTSLSFDLTITSLFTPLITGNTVVVYPEQQYDNIVERIIDHNKVGVIKLTPSHLSMIRDKTIETHRLNLKRFIVGGEMLDARLAADIHNNFAGNIEIYNEYGPTEATVGCMIYRFDPASQSGPSVPIGRPAHNMKIYLLDRYLNPVPPGAVGEIYIAGIGLARGYLNKPELTRGSFVKPPLDPAKLLLLDNLPPNKSFGKVQETFSRKGFLAAGGALYKTGDLGQWLPDGNIEYIGRIDQQVKIRGYRIELSEIENRLAAVPGIKEAVVLAKQDPHADKYLCGYYVSDQKFDPLHLKKILSANLPQYMVPSFFV